MIGLDPFNSVALSLHHNPGAYALLLGSGLSKAAGIPTGWEITLSLIRRLAALDGVTTASDWSAWYRDRYGKEPSYSEILDSLASTPAERRAILHEYIEPRDGEEGRRPTKAHHAVARMVVAGNIKLIVTTNFDRLLENALREAGVEPTIVSSEDAVTGATPLVHARCTVIKVHGDYLDARIRNTDRELETYGPQIDRLLDEVFDRFGLVIVGWSGDWDVALRSALLRSVGRRYAFYWASRGQPSQLASDLIDFRAGKVVPIADADSFFTRLSDALEALKLADQPHPQNVATAVALAKRYCREDRFALEWTEFVTSEVAKVREFVLGGEYPTSQPDAASINDLIAKFLAQSEVLRRICLVCGRWGTADATRVVVRALRSITFQSEPQGGFTYWIELRDFAACICFYWCLLGAVARDDYEKVRIILHAPVRGNGKEHAMVSVLAITAMGQIEWKILKGYENRRTPGSDFLFELFRKECGDISLPSTEAEELFDQAELLISLEFAHLRLKRVEDTGMWFWAPVGRFIWSRHGETAVTRLAKFDDLPASNPLLLAGLLGGTTADANKALEALREHFKGIRSW